MSKSKFYQLQQKWYKILQKNGFEDIEDTNMPGSPLLQWSERIQSNYTPDQFKEKQRYYELASQLIYSEVFESEKHQKVWELHAEGWTAPKIGKAMHLTVSQVSYIIDKYSQFIVKK